MIKMQIKLNLSFLKSYINEFVTDYEIELVRNMNSDICTALKLGDEEEASKEHVAEFIAYVESDEYEIKVLENAMDYCLKSSKVISSLIERNFEKFGTIDSALILSNNSQKNVFIGRKLKQLGVNVDIRKIVNGKPTIKKSNLLIGGRKPNYSERYKIANDTLGLFTNINNRNISQTEKHILLAHILGCSQQVARELFNGTQQKRTPVREDMINKYLDTLN